MQHSPLNGYMNAPRPPEVQRPKSIEAQGDALGFGRHLRGSELRSNLRVSTSVRARRNFVYHLMIDQALS